MRVHAKAIRYFDAIRRAGSIRAAARLLHVDPSAVNRQLLNLENDTGALLFDRLPGGLRLTQAGEVFSQHVITVLQDEQRTAHELARLQGLEHGEIRVVSLEGLHLARRWPWPTVAHISWPLYRSANLKRTMLNAATMG